MTSYSFNDAGEYAKKKLGMDGWEPHSYEVVEGGCLVTGCVPSGVYSRGPRKGHPKFRPAMPGTEKRFIVSDGDMQAAIAEYESSGTCFRCKGSGQQWVGWSVAEGDKYCDCRRCMGVGKVIR